MLGIKIRKGLNKMKTFSELLIAEVTEHEFKSELEIKKPKSWLKTVSAFANGIGGSLYFGVDDNGEALGTDNMKKTIDEVSRLIRERISPVPELNITVERVDDGKNILILQIPKGDAPPYYYVADGNIIAYVRIGNQSVQATPHKLSELVRRGQNISFDSMPTKYKVTDLSFTILDAAFKRIAQKILTMKEYISFGLCQPDGTLTYAGLMFADDSPLLQCRVFCTRWDGLNKSGGVDDAIDAEEFEGDIISLLRNSHNFVRLNSKVRWKKMPDHRINKPDYADRAVFEALANAFMHRDYSIIGSEVHVDMYDDRIDIYSPGGMPDGSLIQAWDINNVPSMRRNLIIADIFNRLEFSERQGSGLRKIREETEYLYGYTQEDAPKFISTPSTFHVVLKNMNYDLVSRGDQDSDQVSDHDDQDVRMKAIVEFCTVARTREEMKQYLGMAHNNYFRKTILRPLIDSGKLSMTIPEKPNSRNQKYIRTQ